MSQVTAGPPFTVQRIDHVVLRVSDLARALHFYRDVLGCSVARERPSLGMIHLQAGTSVIDLVDIHGKLGLPGGAAAGEQGRNMAHVCLRVEPFDEDELRAHLQRHGVSVEGPASRNFGAEGDGASLYIRDPDGNGVELKGPSSDCGC